MNRQIIQLHTIQQWLSVDAGTRSLILQAIRVKDRLYRFLQAQDKAPREEIPHEGKWVPCGKCNQKGWVLKTPRSAGIHPSQVISPCLLKLYWQMVGREEKAKHDTRTLLTFDVGHAVHHMFQSYGMKGAWGPRYQAEVRMTDGSHPLSTELMIEGSADAENFLIIEDIPGPYIFEVGLVHEYKTIKSANFAKLTRPKPDHKEQATIYSAVLDRPVVVFLYFSKDDANLADFPVEFDPAVWGRMEQKARLLLQYFDAKQEPQGAPGFHCKDCGFVYDCPAAKAAAKLQPIARR